jgi:hypothetical protein
LADQSTTSARQQNITRECHTLPVCYQQAFTNANGELYVQFLDKEKPIPLHPSVVGKINDFYTRTINGVDDDGTEKFFSRFVEGEYAAVAKRIVEEKNKFVFRKDEAIAVLKFVVTQIVRTEAHRRSVEAQAKGPISQDSFLHNLYRKMKLIVETWQQRMPYIKLWTTLPHLQSQFIIGDNPVVCFNNCDEKPVIQSPLPESPKITDLKTSLASSQNGFIVPLSPYVCLTVINSGTRDSVPLVPPQIADPVDVRNLNQMIYRQCVLFVAAQQPEHLSFHRVLRLEIGA